MVFVLAVLDVLGIRGFGFLLGFGSILAFFLTGRAPEYPACEGAVEPLRITARQTVVRLQPTCWSEWVNLPGIRQGHQFRWRNEGRLELLFDTGGRVDGHRQLDISAATWFRMRGDGDLTILRRIPPMISRDWFGGQHVLDAGDTPEGWETQPAPTKSRGAGGKKPANATARPSPHP